MLVTADTSDDLVVLARRGLTVRDTAGGAATDLPDNGARQWRVAQLGRSDLGVLPHAALAPVEGARRRGEFTPPATRSRW